MTGLMQRIFRRRSGANRLPWGKKAVPAVAVSPPAARPAGAPAQAPPATAAASTASFRDRGRLRRRLRFLRRARELAYRDIGGLTFDMRRFGRNRQDLVEAKLAALYAVDQELRALERALDDRRPIHELREPGISSCARCGALHSSEANFCPHCGLQLGGPRVMGEVGGAIAAPPQPPQPPAVTGAPAPAPAPAQQPAAPPPAPSAQPPAQPTQSLRPPAAPDGS